MKRRNKGEGSISKLPNGHYKATITIGKGIDGKQKRRSITCSTKTELIDKLAELKVHYNLLSPKEALMVNSTITLASFATDWLEERQQVISYNSNKHYEKMVKVILDTFGLSICLKDITADVCNKYLIYLIRCKRYSANTIRALKTTLSLICKTAHQRNLIALNPMSDLSVKTPAPSIKADLYILDETQIHHMLEVAKKGPICLYGLVCLDIATGLRRGELIGLKWSCVSLDTDTITINNQVTEDNVDSRPKTPTSFRTIHVSHKVLKFLWDNMGHNKSPYVFTGSNGKHLNPTKTTAAIRSLFDAAGLPDTMTLHDLRHYHATQLLKQGVNVKVVSRRLGHKSVITTLNLYFNYIPSMDSDASKLADKEFNGCL